MPKSTRIGYVGNVEVHLKSRLQITREIAASVQGLPSSEPWYVVTRNTNTGEWLFENSFQDFAAADQAWVDLCHNEGLNKAKRLGAGATTPGRGRVVREGG